MIIAGYHTSSDNSNSQQQPTTDNTQTSKLLQVCVSHEEQKPPQLEYTHDNSSMLTLFPLLYL